MTRRRVAEQGARFGRREDPSAGRLLRRRFRRPPAAPRRGRGQARRSRLVIRLENATTKNTSQNTVSGHGAGVASIARGAAVMPNPLRKARAIIERPKLRGRHARGFSEARTRAGIPRNSGKRIGRSFPSAYARNERSGHARRGQRSRPRVPDPLVATRARVESRADATRDSRTLRPPR